MKNFHRFLLLVLVACIACATAACAGEEAVLEDETALSVLGPNDKADNFRSETAQEYYVRGQATITLESTYLGRTEAERVARVQELIPYQQVVIGYFLNTYLIDKSNDASNANYGGLKALTKNGSYEDLEIEHIEGLTYSFGFVQEIGGQFDLLRALQAEAQEDGSHRFQLAVGKLSNAEMERLDHENEWYRRAPWSSFSTTSVDASRWYLQDLFVVAQPRSNDAWIDYARLFADGKLSIGAFFGWDYHGDYHQKHAKTTYEWLLRNGFRTPVANWGEYASRRAPLTRTIKANGKSVEVSITLWWGEPGTSTDPDTDAGGRVLEEAMRASFRDHDVTMFSGHSGPWYGFALANWKKTSEGDLDDSEIPTLNMPADRYQVVLAEGCDTYALGQAFWANPAKSNRQNLDIITTTSFSNAATSKVVTDFLGALVGTDTQANHTPMRYSKLLRSMDSASTWFKTMYGVHGIDNNPQGHPYANTAALCDSCSRNTDCGGVGNRCLDLQGAKVCSFECTSDAGCPTGYICRETSTGSWLADSYCVPATYTCEDVVIEDEPTVLINEVMADPRTDLNGDGRRDSREDEYIELYNPSSKPIDLAGWKLSDNVTVRFTFPYDSIIEPGGYLLVFGGADTATFTGLPNVRVFSSQGLFLNNTGDAVTLAGRDGKVVDHVSYATEGGRGKTLNRRSLNEAPLLEMGTNPTPGTVN
ncbi:MAG: lamin tail domain-containing protein [Bradymonadaceae bacterium]|nr:lamin tail domain-containing protein [Lujinxingiaceae bacterium]